MLVASIAPCPVYPLWNPRICCPLLWEVDSPTPLALAPLLTARRAHQRKASVGGEKLGVSSCSLCSCEPHPGASPTVSALIGLQ